MRMKIKKIKDKIIKIIKNIIAKMMNIIKNIIAKMIKIKNIIAWLRTKLTVITSTIAILDIKIKENIMKKTKKHLTKIKTIITKTYWSICSNITKITQFNFSSYFKRQIEITSKSYKQDVFLSFLISLFVIVIKSIFKIGIVNDINLILVFFCFFIFRFLSKFSLYVLKDIFNYLSVLDCLSAISKLWMSLWKKKTSSACSSSTSICTNIPPTPFSTEQKKAFAFELLLDKLESRGDCAIIYFKPLNIDHLKNLDNKLKEKYIEFEKENSALLKLSRKNIGDSSLNIKYLNFLLQYQKFIDEINASDMNKDIIVGSKTSMPHADGEGKSLTALNMSEQSIKSREEDMSSKKPLLKTQSNQVSKEKP